MSAAPGEDRKQKLERLGWLPRPLALAVLAIWAALTVTALIGVISVPALWSGAGEGLIPVEHRSPRGRPLALVRIDHEALASKPPSAPTSAAPEQELDPDAVLAEAALAIEEALGDERIPLAPPQTEITRWLDAHAL